MSCFAFFFSENLIPCHCETDKCSGFIGKRKKAANDAVSRTNSNKNKTTEKQQVDQHVDEIERGDANIEETTAEEQHVDFSIEDEHVDQPGRGPTPRDIELEQYEQDNEHEQRENETGNSDAAQRATKRGRPLKKNSHKRTVESLKNMKGRRSKSSLKTLKLRLSRVGQQTNTDEEDSDSN